MRPGIDTESLRAEQRSGQAKTDLASFYDQLPADFKEKRGLKPLADRAQRGFNPLAMMAVSETAPLVRSLQEKQGADSERLLDVAAVLQSGGPWEYADRFKAGDDPEAKTWLMLSAMSTMLRPKEMDLTASEFSQDIDRLQALLKAADQDPEGFYEKAREHVFGGLEQAKADRRHVIEDGVPISELDDGFLYAALEGHKSAVVIDADGMLFVGGQGIDDQAVEQWGLHAETAQDERGREVTYYVNESGDRLVKKLYDGFAIVLSRNLELAKAVARVAAGEEAEPPSKEALGHVMYQPSSAEIANEEDKAAVEFMRRATAETGESPLPEQTTTALVRTKDFFYDRIRQVKAMIKALDAVEAAESRAADKGKELKPGEAERIAAKEYEKMDQKVAELAHIMGVLQPDLARLSPDEPVTVMDMAGGAGDLGLATSVNLLAEGKRLKETQIVDPFSKPLGLDHFMDLIVSHSPFREELEQKVRQTYQPLQEAEIAPDALVVAKHACGTLSDDILERWVNSESETVCMMTCCQEKAADYAPRYGFSRAEWKMLCQDSGGTSITGPALEEFLKPFAASNGYTQEQAEQAVLEAAHSPALDSRVWDGMWASLHEQGSLPDDEAARLSTELVDKLSIEPDEATKFTKAYQQQAADVLKAMHKKIEKKPKEAAKIQDSAEGKLKKAIWKFWFDRHFEKRGVKADVSTNAAMYLRGMQAMTALDEGRLEYLKRRGYDAELKQTTAFPKGDVIVARKTLPPKE